MHGEYREQDHLARLTSVFLDVSRVIPPSYMICDGVPVTSVNWHHLLSFTVTFELASEHLPVQGTH